MTIAYGLIFALSLLLPPCYFIFVRKKQDEPWLFILFLSVCVVNFGYMLLSLSRTVAFALTANKIAYFGQVFVPLCMFMIISGLCGFTYKKWVNFVLIGAALAMFALVLTTGHLDWYYKSVELTQVDGAVKLVKEYGFLHPINLIYVLAYFIAMFAVIGVSLKKNKGKSYKLVGLMFAVVIGNIGMWIVEKFITWNFEFLSISYLMSEFVFFFVYLLLQDYIHVKDIPAPIVEEKSTVVVVDSTTVAEKMQLIFSRLAEDRMLTAKEIEVLEKVLSGKTRKELADELNISENTAKTHLKHIYEKLGISNKQDLLNLVHKTF